MDVLIPKPEIPLLMKKTVFVFNVCLCLGNEHTLRAFFRDIHAELFHKEVRLGTMLGLLKGKADCILAQTCMSKNIKCLPTLSDIQYLVIIIEVD